MDSFKNFIMSFQEMARTVGSKKPPMDIFDDYDKRYYKYILTKAREQGVTDPDTLRLIMQKSICARYGQCADPKTGGMLIKARDANADHIDLTFKFMKHKPVTITGIPFGTKQLLDKIREAGWNVDDPSFGYKFGPCTWKGMMGVRGQQYIDFFDKGKMPEPKHMSYHPKDDAAAIAATPEDRMRRQQALERGSGKKKRDFEEFDVKSMEMIPLDAEDQKYLDSVRASFLEWVKKTNPFSTVKESFVVRGFRAFAEAKDDPGQRFLPGMDPNEPEIPEPEPEPEIPENAMNKVLQYALALRYSDKWVTKNEQGHFIPRYGKDIGDISFPMLFPIPGHPQGKKVTKHVQLHNIHLGLPHLVQKFERFKHARDFVKEPLNKDMRLGLQVAQRWMASKSYGPNIGTRYGTNMPDKAFYDQISKDFEAWQRGGGRPVEGNPVDDPQLAAKLLWRRDNEIMESPNIADANLKRDEAKFPTWEKLLKDDARRATGATIRLLIDRMGDRFRSWIETNPEEKMQMELKALAELTTRKTGVNPSEYRKESKRLRWCNEAASRHVDDFFKKQRASGEGGKGEEEGLGISDLAVSKERGNSVNTMAPTSKTDEPTSRPDDIVTWDAGTEPEEEEQSGRMSPEDQAKWLAALQQQQQQQAPAPAVPMRVKGKGADIQARPQIQKPRPPKPPIK